MPEVKVTLFSDRKIHVPDDEIPVLRAQGLLVEDEAPAAPPEADAPPATRDTAAKAAPTTRKDQS